MTEFHKLVRENGWTVLRQTGSHVIYKKGSVIYPVPYQTEDGVLGLAMEFLQDYHDAIHCGYLTSDNRLPTDIDMQDMADIALAILVEYEVISIFGSVEQKKRECFEQLKKLYENG